MFPHFLSNNPRVKKQLEPNWIMAKCQLGFNWVCLFQLGFKWILVETQLGLLGLNRTQLDPIGYFYWVCRFQLGFKWVLKQTQLGFI